MQIDLAKPTADLTNFPVLVAFDATYGKIPKGNIAAGCYAFYNGSGTRLNFETDATLGVSGDYATGKIWTCVPLINSAATSSIWMYYDLAATDKSNTTTAVWTGFGGVYHLGESAGQCLDSTANAAHGDYKGTLPATTSGAIGAAQDFTKAGEFATFGDLPSLNTGSSSFTQEGWYYAGGTSDICIFESDIGVAPFHDTAILRFLQKAYGELYFTYNPYVNAGSEQANAWNHVALVRVVADKDIHLYLNGQDVGSTADTTVGSLTTVVHRIGIWSWGSKYQANQPLDEIRLHPTEAKSPAWIAYEYGNVANAGNNLTFGSEESAPPSYFGYPYPILDPMKGGFQ